MAFLVGPLLDSINSGIPQPGSAAWTSVAPMVPPTERKWNQREPPALMASFMTPQSFAWRDDDNRDEHCNRVASIGPPDGAGPVHHGAVPSATLRAPLRSPKRAHFTTVYVTSGVASLLRGLSPFCTAADGIITADL